MRLKGSPYAWVSFAMIVGVMGTALISPLYALYKETWHLQTSDISFIYVIYMAGALSGLLFLGRLPDRLGFLPTMKSGLWFILVGTLLTMFSKDVTSLSIGRFVVGLASSMVTTSSTAGLAKLSPSGNMQRASMMTGFLMALGFGLGPLVGGFFGQWVPNPLMSTYVPTVLLGILAVTALYTVRLPRKAVASTGERLTLRSTLPKLTWPGSEQRGAFMLTCCLPFLGFGVFGLYASMAPLFLKLLIPWDGPAVSGTAIAMILFLSATVQILAVRLPTQYCGAMGLAGMALSNGLLMANLWLNSAVLFVLGVLFTSVSHGMAMLAGMSMLNRLTSPSNRSGLFSTYLVTGYIGTMVPIMGIGWIADMWGMNAAVSTFCVFVVVTGFAVAVTFYRHPQTRAKDTDSSPPDTH